MVDVTGIRGFHAHIYFDPETLPAAERLQEALVRRFDVKLGGLHTAPAGPHTKGNFEVRLAPDQFASVVTWLMINREGLSVLVHPNTDDPIADHDTNPLWMGERVYVDLEVLRHFLQLSNRQ
jgi:DOPA 4,5-dioxygenase